MFWRRSLALDLPILKLDGRGAAEDVDGDAKLAALRIDLLDNAVLRLERTVSNLYGIADFEGDGGADGFFTFLNLGKHRINLTLAHGSRTILCACKTDDTIHLLDEEPGLLDKLIVLGGEIHVYDDIAGEEFLLCLGFLTTLDFGYDLCRHQHLADVVLHLFGYDTSGDTLAHLSFHAREDLDDIPLVFIIFGVGHEGIELSRRKLAENFGQKADDKDLHEIPELDKSSEENDGNENNDG